MKKYSMILAAAMLLPLAACKEMPENFAAMPDYLSDEELIVPDNTPAYKRTESYYVDGELSNKYETIYDEHDHMISENEINIETGEPKPAMYQKYAKEYDQDGNLLKDIWYSANGTDIFRVMVNTYDDDGKMLTTVDYFNDGGKLKKRTYYEMSYDDRGNETEWFSADAEDGIDTVCKYTYEYDDKGNIARKTVDNSTDKDEIVEYTYTYDDDGNMLTETQKRTDRKSGKDISNNEFTSEYEYDDSGKLIKKTSDVYHFEQHVVETYEYDEKGRLTRETKGADEHIYEYEDLK